MTGCGVRGLASPRPFLGGTPLAVEARVVLVSAVFFLVQFVVATWSGDFEAGLGAFFGEFCAIFRTLPRGGESRGARIFRALDDEEFFVVEGSPGWR